MKEGLGLELTAAARLVRSRIRFEDLARQPFVPPDGDIHHRNETLFGNGDPRLMLHLGRAGSPWSYSGRLGVSIPLGRTEENPFLLGHHGLRHQHIQFGTGTWDPMVGVGAGRQFGRLNLSASGLARFTLYENRHGFRPGNRYAANLSGEHGLGAKWGGNVGLEVAREEAERWDGTTQMEGNLGRTDLLCVVGLGRTFNALGYLAVTAHVPLVTRATGAQVDYPVLLSLAWTR